MEKYEITRETKVIDGVELHRIKALKSFGNVKKGDLGGWIESEKTIAHNTVMYRRQGDTSKSFGVANNSHGYEFPYTDYLFADGTPFGGLYKYL